MLIGIVYWEAKNFRSQSQTNKKIERFFFTLSLNLKDLFHNIQTSISYPLIRTRTWAYQELRKVPFFRKIWRALFSWNTRFEIRPFALLPTHCEKVGRSRSSNVKSTGSILKSQFAISRKMFWKLFVKHTQKILWDLHLPSYGNQSINWLVSIWGQMKTSQHFSGAL